MTPRTETRRATSTDASAVARLLDAFNREYDTPTPGVDVLQGRVERMIGAGEIVVFLVGDGPDGLALLEFRPSVWGEVPDAYLAELYVVPERRGQGMGSALLTATLRAASASGADVLDLNTSEDDVAARALYEKFGFSNREHRVDGPRQLYYEREL